PEHKPEYKPGHWNPAHKPEYKPEYPTGQKNNTAPVNARDALAVAPETIVLDKRDFINKRRWFTQEKVAWYMANNPNPAQVVAAVCYNQDYGVRNPDNILLRQSWVVVRDGLSLEHVTYDCMYIKRDNTFWTYGDGGYENLAYSYNSEFCTYDSNTGDLDCK
ncbi:hypothetical protein PTT_10013, partial [Pyrenophora teres f. teres 0-1]